MRSKTSERTGGESVGKSVLSILSIAYYAEDSVDRRDMPVGYPQPGQNRLTEEAVSEIVNNMMRKKLLAPNGRLSRTEVRTLLMNMRAAMLYADYEPTTEHFLLNTARELTINRVYKTQMRLKEDQIKPSLVELCNASPKEVHSRFAESRAAFDKGEQTCRGLLMSIQRMSRNEENARCQLADCSSALNELEEPEVLKGVKILTLAEWLSDHIMATELIRETEGPQAELESPKEHQARLVQWMRRCEILAEAGCSSLASARLMKVLLETHERCRVPQKNFESFLASVQRTIAFLDLAPFYVLYLPLPEAIPDRWLEAPMSGDEEPGPRTITTEYPKIVGAELRRLLEALKQTDCIYDGKDETGRRLVCPTHGRHTRRIRARVALPRTAQAKAVS